MYTVYVLYSPSFNKIYIGFTNNLEHRLRQHNELSKKGYTKRYRPWEIAYTELHDTEQKAAQREKQLKTSRGRAFIWDLIKQKY